MNKSELIDAVSVTTSLAKRDAEQAVNAVVRVVAGEVRAGRRVVVTGFGSFNPTHRGARMGRNPQNGAPVRIAAARGVRFAASGALKDIVNGRAALPALKPAGSKPATAKKAAKRTGKATTQRSARQVATRAPARKSATRPAKKIVGRAPAHRAAKRAPARKAAQQSARKAAGRAPARKAVKRSAKKAVRRA